MGFAFYPDGEELGEGEVNYYVAFCFVEDLELVLVHPFAEIQQGKIALLQLLAELLNRGKAL